ncbi:MAG: DUF1292 domain-containing protein, partial [Oscillospiraceae bacterium]|nr:DUF1292 domain-containing protein [Oscillospiraceae bacterium]
MMPEISEFGPDLYTLVDEEGVEQTFELLDVMEAEGNTYYALVPYAENPEDILEGSDELVVLKMEEVDGEELLASIEDDEEFERIGQMFLDRIMEEFEDEEDFDVQAANDETEAAFDSFWSLMRINEEQGGYVFFDDDFTF